MSSLLLLYLASAFAVVGAQNSTDNGTDYTQYVYPLYVFEIFRGSNLTRRLVTDPSMVEIPFLVLSQPLIRSSSSVSTYTLAAMNTPDMPLVEISVDIR